MRRQAAIIPAAVRGRWREKLRLRDRGNSCSCLTAKPASSLDIGMPATESKTSPQAIIDTAERLFGDHGVLGVSIRQIGQEAKMANNSAINYHFGDRAGLVRAIWAHRLPVLDQMRTVLLQDLEQQGRTQDRHGVLRALMLPTYLYVDEDGVHRYAAFFRSVMRWREGRPLRAQEMHASPASERALGLVQALAPDLPHQLMIERLVYASGVFHDMIIDRDYAIAEDHEVAPEDAFLHEAIDMMAAMIFRPAP